MVLIIFHHCSTCEHIVHKLNSKQNSDELLKILNQNAKVIHFKEVIPSANEIFINSVKNN